MRETGKDYYLGLDMGTNSVGWAVTDENYVLMRAKGKDLWGIREFDEALTAVDRRTHRVARRRHQREIARIGLLKEYFHDAIAEVDPDFYQRLDNSKYHEEDKDSAVKGKNGIFNDANYNDKDYFKQYPTIFHLRKELIESTEKHDVRLVYLALLNMFKHRGHFLNAGLSTESENTMDTAYHNFVETAAQTIECNFMETVDIEKIKEILGSRDYSRSKKAELVAQILHVDSKNKVQMACIKCICGLKVTAAAIFGDKMAADEEKKTDICFSDFGYDEKVPVILEIVGEENFELVLAMQEIYDIGSLAGIMKDSLYLSMARVKEYEQHGKDLRILKGVVKKYGTKEEYDTLFRTMEEGTYSAYVNSVNTKKKSRRDVKKRTRDEFYGRLKKIISKMPQNDSDVLYIKDKMEKEAFLPKQLTASNGVIPNQIHAREMKKILQNAEIYLPFLKEKDTSGLTVSERILKLFSFQIPYYVGPVSEKSKLNGGNGWVVRKEEGTVLPWNIEEKIDMTATSREFVERMVRRCSYLSDERVLPKGSLLYERFCVLNEINAIKVDGVKIPVEIKQDLYSKYFKKGKKVTKKKIAEFLIARGVIKEDQTELISGIDIAVNSTLSTYAKFYAIFGEKMEQDSYKKMVEQIVEWCTIYGDAKKFLEQKIKECYGNVLTQEEIKRITGFKFRDWGRLSKEFLELSGCSKATGEVMPLISMMWETNDNLMELLDDNYYTYREALEEKQNNAFKLLADIEPEDLDEMYFSAPVKRMVWQTLCIIKELEKVLGKAPKRLFVEMTRNEQKDKKRTDSRKQQFLDLYKNIKDESRDWKELITRADENGTLKSKKMYLYLIQMGRCMYTGHPIDLEDLFKDNRYDIDHIYPRHFVKDDNIMNNLVLVEKEKNAHKSDNYPLEEEIYKKQLPMWKDLHQRKLITDEKFKRLTGRNEFTDEQKAGFIARQLVETSQGTKGVTTILERALPDTKIVYAKASNVSEFRQKRDLLKSRVVNDFHHAQDAYLNIVVGNVYFVKFTQNPLHFIKAEYDKNKAQYEYNLSRMFDRDVRRGNETAWIGCKKGEEAGTILTVKKMMAKNTPMLTRLSFEGKGGLADQTLYSAEKAKGNGYSPLKTSDSKMQDVTKYGGFNSVSTAYFFLVEHELKGKKVRTLETVPIIWRDRIQKDETMLLKYCTDVLELKNPSIRVKKIKLQSYIKKDGYYMYITGKTNKQITTKNAVELCVNQRWIDYIKIIEKTVEKKKEECEEIDYDKNVEFYDLLLTKHTQEIFSNRPNPVGAKLKQGRDKFVSLTLLEQCRVLYEILQLSIIGNTRADLQLIGGAAISGVMLLSKNITDSKEFILINQSVTGLFEQKVDLLTV